MGNWKRSLRSCLESGSWTKVPNDLQINDQLVEKLMKKILKYLRLFLEELLSTSLKKEEQNTDTADLLKEVYEIGKSCTLAESHHKYDLCALYWETFFFSGDPKHQIYAVELLEAIPELPQKLDYEHLLARLAHYHRRMTFDYHHGLEHFHRKLMEISLKFNLGAYQKQRAYENLLIYYCERGNLQSATPTMESAHSLGIPIGTDAMQIFLNLKRDL